MTHTWSFGAEIPSGSGSTPDGLRPGERFGPYELLGLIGEGSSSRVWRARNPSGGLVALKVFRQGLDERTRERFQREGRLAAALEHPGVVPIEAGGEIAGVPFLTCQLVDAPVGFTMHLTQCTLPQRVELLASVADIVGHAHTRGIVHRDLKPANILIDAQGRPRVTDFGLALAPGVERLTLSGETVGTPLTMAPEQLEARRDAIGPHTDVWAMGVMLYQALTGRHPFSATTWKGLREQVLGGQAPPPSQGNPALPPLIDRVCSQALARDPESRTPNGAELAHNLRQVLQLGQVPAAPRHAPALRPPVRPPSSSSAAANLGRKGRFELLSVLGKGGMGVVYRARDPELDREVALKVIQKADRPGSRLERFRREGELTATLQHPGIVRVHGTDMLDGTPCLIYELVPDARTLDDVLPDLDTRERLEILRDISRALGYAHAQGIVHRDVKPDNILIDTAGRARVTDFGLAAAKGLERLTRTGALLGTPYFMAPELFEGSSKALGPPADVWALGVILYRCLTDELPFDAPSMAGLAAQICSQRTPSPRSSGSGVNRRLEAICFKALAKEPAARYPDANALADDLEAYLAGRPLSASTTVTWLPGFLRLRRGQAAALGAALVVLLVSVGLLICALSLDPPEPEEAATKSTPPPATTPEEPPPPKTGPQPVKLATRILRHDPRGGRVEGIFHAGWIYTCGEDGTVCRWDPSTGKLERRFEFTIPRRRHRLRGIVSVGKGVYVGGDGNALFRIEGDTTRRIPIGGPINALAASPNGRFLAVGTHMGHVSLIHVAAMQTRRLSRVPVQAESLAFSRDSLKLAAVVLMDRNGELNASELHIWDLNRDPPPPPVRKELPAHSKTVAFAPDGRIVAGFKSGHIQVCDPETGVRIKRLKAKELHGPHGTLISAGAHNGSVRDFTFSSKGDLISISKGATKWKNELRVWSATKYEPTTTETNMRRVVSVELSPDGRQLLLGTEEGVAELRPAP